MTPTTNTLDNSLPFVIRTEEDYSKALSITENLFFKKNRTAKEEQLLDVWGVLIEIYEEEVYPLGSSSTPASVLTSLMEARKLTQADLVREGIGSKELVSEIVNGKRAISQQQATKLAAIFKVASDIFTSFPMRQ